MTPDDQTGLGIGVAGMFFFVFVFVFRGSVFRKHETEEDGHKMEGGGVQGGRGPLTASICKKAPCVALRPLGVHSSSEGSNIAGLMAN